MNLLTRIKLQANNPIFLWIIVFIVGHLIFRQYGATNEMSRYATLRAMSDQFTFKIDDYQDWTVDWAKRENHYYSNKAPGPMLIGFPLFYFLDQFSKFDHKNKLNKQGARITRVSSTPRVIMALITQILPFCMVCLLIVTWMQKNTNLQQASFHIFALCALFANSATIFMNTFFGHGMAAVFLLAMALAWLKKKYFSIGLFFGLTLLTEYTAALFLLPLILSIILYDNMSFKKWVPPFVLGGVFPGLLWCFYHYHTMGSIFSLPTQFQNPRFTNTADTTQQLWGAFSLPKYEILMKLLFGLERGILFTQPWVFIVFLLGIKALFRPHEKSYIKKTSLFAVSGLFLLLLLNSSFNGWHGGGTSGPRYLALIFPVFALLAASFWHHAKIKTKYLMGVSLIIGLLFRILVYGSRSTAPEGHSLWPWLFKDLIAKEGLKGEIRSLSLACLLIMTGLYYYKKSMASLETPSLDDLDTKK